MFCTEWRINSISSWIKFSFVPITLKYYNCATFLKDLLAIFMSWICPAFWWRASNIYLVFSAFISRRTSLLASKFLCLSIWYLRYHPTSSLP
jgi:hypothetical protein